MKKSSLSSFKNVFINQVKIDIIKTYKTRWVQLVFNANFSSLRFL